MSKVRVLLVEDDREMCEELIPILEGGGYRMDVVHDGNAAIARLEREEFGLALLDLKMPGINGYEVLKYIKRTHPMVKVIVLSGSPLRSQILKPEEQIFPEGTNYHELIIQLADAFVSKPFDVERLLGMMKKFLPPTRGDG